MSLFRIFTYDHTKDLSRDLIDLEIQRFRDADEGAQKFIDAALDLFECDYDELEELIWHMHRAVTTGGYSKSFNIFRATDVVPFYLNVLRLVEEYPGGGRLASTCEHLLNVFWAHLKLTFMLNGEEGRLITYDAGSCFKYSDLDALSFEEVSWHSCLSLGSVANAASFGQDHPRNLLTIKKDGKTLVSRDDAIKWLKGCSAYKAGFMQEDGEVTSGETLLVPVAKDGSFINHTCLRARGVQIGPKGNETYVPTLKEAIDILSKERESKQGPARWRRPNENGNFGIVSGVRWEERTHDEIFG